MSPLTPGEAHRWMLALKEVKRGLRHRHKDVQQGALSRVKLSFAGGRGEEAECQYGNKSAGGLRPPAGGELDFHIAEEVLHTVKPTALTGRILAVFHGGLKLAQQLFLFVPEIDRRLHHHSAHQIAGAAATYWGDAFTTQAKQLAGLGFRRDLEFDPAIERRHFQLATEGGVHKIHGHFAIKGGTRSEERRVGKEGEGAAGWGAASG